MKLEVNMETQNIVPCLEFIIHMYLLFISMQTIVLLHNCKKDTWKHIFIMTVNNTIKLHKLINYNKSQMKIILEDCVTVADKSSEAIKCL